MRDSSSRCWPSTRQTCAKADAIKDIEHICDGRTRAIIDRLNRTFVTPLDREDIHSLAISLDDVMDAIDAAAAVTRLYKITQVRPGARRLTEIICDSIDRLCEAFVALEKAAGRPRARRAGQSARTRSRPRASGRDRGALRRGARSDRRHQVEGDPRLPRSGHRSMRGRRQSARRRHRQARLAAAARSP